MGKSGIFAITTPLLCLGLGAPFGRKNKNDAFGATLGPFGATTAPALLRSAAVVSVVLCVKAASQARAASTYHVPAGGSGPK